MRCVRTRNFTVHTWQLCNYCLTTQHKTIFLNWPPFDQQLKTEKNQILLLLYWCLLRWWNGLHFDQICAIQSGYFQNFHNDYLDIAVVVAVSAIVWPKLWIWRRLNWSISYKLLFFNSSIYKNVYFLKAHLNFVCVYQI